MIEIHRLGARIGAEIRGVDVKTLDDAGFAAIYRAWLDCNVVVVPGQDLQIEDFLRYSRRFGVVHPHPSKMTRHPDHPEITLLGVDKFRPDGALDMAVYRRGAEGWHTDGAYDQEPFKATQLYALAVPSTGGDTLFASMYAAYDALPPRLAQRLDGRIGAFTYGGRRKATALLNAEDRDWTPVFHPIIRTHPETGTEGALLRSRKDPAHRGARRERERRADRGADRSHDPARRPVPSPVAQGRHRHLGQPLLVPQGGGRLPARGRPHPLARLDQGPLGGRWARAASLEPGAASGTSRKPRVHRHMPSSRLRRRLAAGAPFIRARGRRALLESQDVPRTGPLRGRPELPYPGGVPMRVDRSVGRRPASDPVRSSSSATRRVRLAGTDHGVHHPGPWWPARSQTRATDPRLAAWNDEQGPTSPAANGRGGHCRRLLRVIRRRGDHGSSTVKRLPRPACCPSGGYRRALRRCPGKGESETRPLAHRFGRGERLDEPVGARRLPNFKFEFACFNPGVELTLDGLPARTGARRRA